MKKIIVIGALILTVSAPAFAQDNYKDEQAKWQRQIDRSQRQADYSDAATKARIEWNARHREDQRYYRGMQRERLDNQRAIGQDYNDTQRAIAQDYNDTQRAIVQDYLRAQERAREAQDPYGRTRGDIPLQK